MIFIPERYAGALKAVKSPKTKKEIDEATRKLHAKVQRNLLDFRPYVMEYKFHPKRKWRLDYAWPEIKVAIEIHGGVHTQGRHTRGKGFVSDREKMNEAQLLGWIVLEVTPDQLKQMRDWLFRAKEVRDAPD